MVRTTVSALALCSMASAAFAGGIERSAQPTGLLFEEGDYVQFSFSYLEPDVSGTFGGAVSSGDMAPGYTNLSFGYKKQINDKLDLALIIDQPVSADVDYGNAAPTYPFNGVTAELRGTEVSALLKYDLGNGFSVYGGPRAQSITAELDGLPVMGAIYALDVDRTYEFGYAVGAAYERPDIALRVALTYRSAIEHGFESSETFNAGPAVAGAFTTEIPQSLNLEFQTGIAEDTLLFGNVRWQDWSEFDITPPGLMGASLIDYQSDYTTVNLGVGRRFNENWSGAIQIGYEDATGDVQGNLAPRDGFSSIGLGVTYTKDNMKITGGVRYIALGDATTQTIGASFTDNDAIAAGVQIGWQL